MYFDICDAYIFPGGPDIDPSLNSRETAGARGVVADYDRFLLSAMQQVFERRKPVLGICKGMQLMNIAHGGTLKQDIEEMTYHFQPERGYERVDTIEIVGEDSFLANLYGDSLGVNSIHHQAIENLGDGLRTVARSSFDHEIEAIEHTSLPHYGVQWHPEYLGEHRELFRWFIGL